MAQGAACVFLADAEFPMPIRAGKRLLASHIDDVGGLGIAGAHAAVSSETDGAEPTDTGRERTERVVGWSG